MASGGDSTCADVFVACREAMQRAVLIRGVSRSGKEFHFQRWVGDRLLDAGLAHGPNGRNSYPDFIYRRMSHRTTGWSSSASSPAPRRIKW
jgi:hypothetical protein